MMLNALKNAQIVPSLPVKNMQRAKNFYVEKLGLNAVETDAPDTVLFTNSEGKVLTLYLRDEITKSEHTSAIWLVDSVGDTVRMLGRQGVTFEHYDRPNLKTDDRGIAQLGESSFAWFKDSEGNMLAVSSKS